MNEIVKYHGVSINVYAVFGGWSYSFEFDLVNYKAKVTYMHKFQAIRAAEIKIDELNALD